MIAYQNRGMTGRENRLASQDMIITYKEVQAGDELVHETGGLVPVDKVTIRPGEMWDRKADTTYTRVDIDYHDGEGHQFSIERHGDRVCAVRREMPVRPEKRPTPEWWPPQPGDVIEDQSDVRWLARDWQYNNVKGWLLYPSNSRNNVVKSIEPVHIEWFLNREPELILSSRNRKTVWDVNYCK